MCSAHTLQQQVIQNILQSLAIGLRLREDWIIANATIYILNYHNHLCQQNRHFQIVETLQQCYDGMRFNGNNRPMWLLFNCI